MSAAEIGDLIGRILATAFLAAAVGGGVWALAEFIVFTMQWKRGQKRRKNENRQKDQSSKRKA